MSPLCWMIGICVALVITTILYHTGMRISDSYKIRTGQEKDRSLDNTFMVKYNRVPHTVPRMIISCGLILATGIMLIATFSKYTTYQKYGAFYDESWKRKDVEEHFFFVSDDTEKLQTAYNSDPEHFNYDGWKVLVVRFGCKDCEALYEWLVQMDDDYYIIFSRSDIGKKYVEKYSINAVPVIVYEGDVVYFDYEIKTYDQFMAELNKYLPSEE